MQSIIEFIRKYNLAFLFVVFEIISLILIINNNEEKKKRFYNSSNIFYSFFQERTNNISRYFNLKDIAEKLQKENTILHNKLELYSKIENQDTLKSYSKYNYKFAKLIKNSIHKPTNYFTINKGNNHGINEDMGVISSQGIVGIITNTSDNFAVGISILNNKISISAKIRRINAQGVLKWNCEDYRFLNLYEIPNHNSIRIGDTIVTSGYSAIFPEGIIIGTIEDYYKNDINNFYEIIVRLCNNLYTLKNVYIIENTKQKEQINLEEKIIDNN